MIQTFPRFCPQCGSPREAGQRFCPHCGTSLDMAANNLTAMASDQQSTLANPPAPDGPPLAPAIFAADGSASEAPITGAPGIPPPPPPASLSASPALFWNHAMKQRTVMVFYSSQRPLLELAKEAFLVRGMTLLPPSPQQQRACEEPE